jgi:hypothetical protein
MMQGTNTIAELPDEDLIDLIPSLYAPCEEYVSDVVPLMLEHIWQQKQDSTATTPELLTASGWICRLITLDKRVLSTTQQNAIEGWPALRDELVYLIDECPGSKSLPILISDLMLIIMPLLKIRFKKNYTFPARQFHSWWYTVHNDNTELALHLVNAYQPASPFDNVNHFLKTMLNAVEHAIELHPGINKVSCGSWLNGVLKFQQLWPESFTLNQRVLNKNNGFGPGAWGQYMTPNGGFNVSKANILRQTGLHPYPLTEAGSSLEEVLMHLKKLTANPNLMNHE